MTEIKNKVQYVEISSLSELENNPRTIKKDRFEKLKKSIQKNKDYFEGRPVLVNEVGGERIIFAGNQRYKAAKALGWTEVPAVLYQSLSEEKQRELTIRDNVELGEWDMDVLADEWDAEELDEWGVEDVKPYQEIIEDKADPVDEENTYSIVGDIYQLGDHRIFCGSFEDDDKVRELFGNKKATCTFTDPPYNVAYKSADGKSIKNDEMAREDFLDFLSRAFDVVAENTVSGGGCD